MGQPKRQLHIDPEGNYTDVNGGHAFKYVKNKLNSTRLQGPEEGFLDTVNLS